MPSYQCPWCGKDQEFDTSEGFEIGSNLDDCDSCGKANVVYLDIMPFVTNAHKDLPHKMVTCPRCGHCLDNMVNPSSVAICYLCPQCREPYSIEIERIEVADAS